MIDLIKHSRNYELLARHKSVFGKVKHQVKEYKNLGRVRRDERRKANKNEAAKKEIHEGKKLRQWALGIMRNNDGI